MNKRVTAYLQRKKEIKEEARRKPTENPRDLRIKAIMELETDDIKVVADKYGVTAKTIREWKRELGHKVPKKEAKDIAPLEKKEATQDEVFREALATQLELVQHLRAAATKTNNLFALSKAIQVMNDVTKANTPAEQPQEGKYIQNNTIMQFYNDQMVILLEDMTWKRNNPETLHDSQP